MQMGTYTWYVGMFHTHEYSYPIHVENDPIECYIPEGNEPNISRKLKERCIRYINPGTKR